MIWFCRGVLGFHLTVRIKRWNMIRYFGRGFLVAGISREAKHGLQQRVKSNELFLVDVDVDICRDFASQARSGQVSASGNRRT